MIVEVAASLRISPGPAAFSAEKVEHEFLKIAPAPRCTISAEVQWCIVVIEDM
jgi:hypothetical protein